MNADEKFWQFHKANPDIYSELVRLGRQAIARGRKKIGIRMLWEAMRWNRFISTTATDFKLNDHLTSRYARLIAANEPNFADMFELRER